MPITSISDDSSSYDDSSSDEKDTATPVSRRPSAVRPSSSPSDSSSDSDSDSDTSDDEDDDDDAAAPIGPNDFAAWTQATGKESGKLYYFNRTTDERTWDVPAAVAPENWAEAQDPDSGYAFYFNAVTGEKKWRAPPIPALHWSSHVDEATGLAYRSNALTGETEWEEVDPEKDGVRLIDGVRGAVLQSVEEPLWFRCLTERDGEHGSDRPYFFHKETEESVWVAPVADLAWEEAVDEESGARYVFNTMTEEKKWIEDEDAAGGAQNAVEPLDIAPGGWAQFRDDESGEAYWYKEETDERSWLHPDEADRGKFAPWYRYVDDDTGRPFYFNTETEERAWLPPSADETRWFEDIDTEGRSYWFNPVSGEKSWLSPEQKSEYRTGIEPPWYQFTDDESGAPYWYNAETDEKTWDPAAAGGEPFTAEELSSREIYAEAEAAAVGEEESSSSEEESSSSEDSDDDDLQQDDDGGDGWRPHVDHRTGKTYWANRATGETSWSAPVVPIAEVASAGDAGWSTHCDPSTGKTYWANQATGETSWSDPVPVAVAVAVAVAVPVGETIETIAPVADTSTRGGDIGTGWAYASDPVSGRRYRHRNGQTAWVAEGEVELEQQDLENSGDDSEEDSSESEEDSDDESEGLPLGWTAAIDPGSGRAYYFCRATGERSWVRPEGGAAAAAAASATTKLDAFGTKLESLHKASQRMSERVRGSSGGGGGGGGGGGVGADADAAALAARSDSESDARANAVVLLDKTISKLRVLEEKAKVMESEFSGRGLLAAALDDSSATEGSGGSGGGARVSAGASASAAAGGEVASREGERASSSSRSRSPPKESLGLLAVRGHTTLGARQRAAAAKAREDALPQGWKMTLDPASGKEYYFNRKTAQTQWVHPSAAVAADAAREAVRSTR